MAERCSECGDALPASRGTVERVTCSDRCRTRRNYRRDREAQQRFRQSVAVLLAEQAAAIETQDPVVLDRVAARARVLLSTPEERSRMT